MRLNKREKILQNTILQAVIEYFGLTEKGLSKNAPKPKIARAAAIIQSIGNGLESVPRIK